MSYVNPPALPKPVGFNHGVLCEGKRILFLAGQNGTNQRSEVVSDDFAVQFEAALANLLLVLKEAGGAPSNLGIMNIYVTDKKEYARARKAIGEIWRRHLGKHYPAIAMLEVRGLWEDRAKVEIEGIAVLD